MYSRRAELHERRPLPAPDTPPEEAYDRFARLLATLCDAPMARVSAGPSHPIGRLIAERHEELAVADAWLSGDDAVTEHGARAFAGVPLLSGGECVGALYVADHRPREWTAEQLARLRDVAAAVTAEMQLRAAAAEARAARDDVTAKAREQERRHSVLLALGEHGLRQAPERRLFADATRLIATALGVDICAGLRHDADAGTFRIVASHGMDLSRIADQDDVAPAGSLAAYTIGQAEPVVVENWSVERRVVRSAGLEAHGVLSGVSVTIRCGDPVYGVLAALDSRPRRFADEDLRFLKAAANVLALALEARAHESRQRLGSPHRTLMRDPLTALPNRALLTDRLAHVLDRGARAGERHGVLFLDLDRFKLVNDSLGHDVGDSLLRAVAERLRATLRPADTVARFGGDEFVVLCENVGHDKRAVRLARRLIEALERPFDLDGREHVIGVSVGVVVTDGGAASPEDVLRDADTAMYRAKEAGRGGYQLFDITMRERTLARLELEDELRRALVNHELVLDYQPTFRIDDGGLVGAEALVRWNHPTRGLLLPGAFIPIAEESELIVALGERVLELACTQWAGWRAQWPRARELALAVNVSARQLGHPGLVTTVQRILGVTGVPAHALVLEITEGGLLHDARTAADAIAELRREGVRIALDDFGTGYSSLGYLKRFPLDILKIDRSFIRELDERLEDRVIVEAIIAMAHALGMDVTAEGIETPAQLEALRELGSTNAQGFLLSRPLSAQRLEDLLRDA
jgi:diguanylate cyclase (GGDEF)-like protein